MKGNKIFNNILFVLLIIFLTIFVSNKYGYFEHEKHRQVALTQEQIERFEEDIKNGKDISLENYKVTINYQTKLSQAGLNISNYISTVIRKGVNSIFKNVEKVVNQK